MKVKVSTLTMPTRMIPKVTLESLLEDLGGCGLFQWLMVILVHTPTMSAAWSFIFMAFGSFNPGWTCEDSHHSNLSSSLFVSNATSNDSNNCHVHKYCGNVVFNNDSWTIVTEWNLACDKNWITSLMISLENAGNLIGTLSTGHFNHYFGRKVSLYGTLSLHAVFNLVAMFAINWPMYAAIRFMIGLTTGSLFLCAYIYPVEFLTNKWRGPFGALPASNTGFLSFALAAMFLRDWKKLHLVTTLITIVCLIPIFWVPESLRWLTIKGKSKKAHEVGVKIAKVNRSSMPEIELINNIIQQETKTKEKKHVYTIFDLYRHGFLLKTAVVTFAWLSYTLVYYIIMFGVKNLSGNFYVNLCIFAYITTASFPFVPILSNTVGRRWGIIIFLLLSILCCAILLSVRFFNESIDEGLAVTLLSLMLLTCIDGAWAISIVYTVELYPTVLRSLSYSHASCLAKIGGMIAPFLIPDEQRSAFVSYIIMGIITVLTCISIFFLPETKGEHMGDSIKTSTNEENDLVDHPAEI